MESVDFVVKQEPRSDEDDVLISDHQSDDDDTKKKEEGHHCFDSSGPSHSGQDALGGSEEADSLENIEYALEKEMCTVDGERFTVVEASCSDDDEDMNEDEDVNEDGDERDHFIGNIHLEDEHNVYDDLNDSTRSIGIGHSDNVKESVNFVSQNHYGKKSPSSSNEIDDFEIDFRIKEEKLDSGYEGHLYEELPVSECIKDTSGTQETSRRSSMFETARGHQCHDDDIPIQKDFPGLTHDNVNVFKNKYSDMEDPLSDEESDEEWRYGRKKFLYSDNVALHIEQAGSKHTNRSSNKGRIARKVKSENSSRKTKASAGKEEEQLDDVQVYIDTAWEDLKRDNPDITNINGVLVKRDRYEDYMIAQYAIIDREKKEMVGIKSINPKQCHICGMEFEYEFHKKFHVQQVHPDTLKDDKRTAEDQKKYDAWYNKKCFICQSQEFCHPYYLSCHMQKEHPETLIDNRMIKELTVEDPEAVIVSKKKCPVCAETFIFAFQLKYHIQRSHAEVLVEDKRAMPWDLPEYFIEDQEEDGEVNDSGIKVKYTVKDIISIKSDLQKWKFKQELNKARKWEKIMESRQRVRRPEKVPKQEKEHRKKVLKKSKPPVSKRGRRKKIKKVSMMNPNLYPDTTSLYVPVPLKRPTRNKNRSKENGNTRKSGRNTPREKPSPESEILASHTVTRDHEAASISKVFDTFGTEQSLDGIVKQEKESASELSNCCSLTATYRIKSELETEKSPDDESLTTATTSGAKSSGESNVHQKKVREYEVGLTTKRRRCRPRRKPASYTDPTEHETILMSKLSRSSGTEPSLHLIVKQEDDSETDKLPILCNLTTLRKETDLETQKTPDDESLTTETSYGSEKSQESIIHQNVEPESEVCLTTKRGRGRPRKKPRPEVSSTSLETENITGDECLKSATALGTENFNESIINLNTHSESTIGLITKRGRGRPKKKPHIDVSSSLTTTGENNLVDTETEVSPMVGYNQQREIPVNSERRSRRKRKQREMPDFFIFNTKPSAIKECLVNMPRRPVKGPSKNKIIETMPNIFCETCGKVFMGAKAFAEHQSTCRAQELDTPGSRYFPCTKCPKVFHNVSVQHLHMLRDHADSRKTCPFCGKPFAYISALKKHMLVHTNKEVRKALTSLESDEVNDKDSRLVHVLSNLGVVTDIDDDDDDDAVDREKGLELSIALNSVSGAEVLVSKSCSSDGDIETSKLPFQSLISDS